MSEKHGKREKTDFALPVLKHFWSYCIITYIHYLRSIYIRKRKVTNHVFTSLLLSSIHFFINIFSVAFPGAWLHISVLHSVYYGEGNSKCVWFPPPFKKKQKQKTTLNLLTYSRSHPIQWDQNMVPLFGLPCVFQTTATVSTTKVKTSFMLHKRKSAQCVSV